MSAKIKIALFAVLLFGMALGNLLTPERIFSESENRSLQTRPAFSAQRLFSGRFSKDFDTYVTDQFLLRDRWVGLKNMAETAIGRADVNKVYFAKGGYLIEMFCDPDLERYEKNLEYLGVFGARLAEQNIQVRTMLVPSPSLILRDKLHAFAPEADQNGMLDRAAQTAPGFIDLRPVFTAYSAEPLYYRTDHHWTSLGAFYAADVFLVADGKTLQNAGNYRIETLSGSFYGTTWSKANTPFINPDTIEAWQLKDAGDVAVDEGGEQIRDSLYARSFLEEKDKYSVFLGENQAMVHIRTQAANGRKLLLVKDSYANCFVQFLLRDYEDIYMLDPRFYRESYPDFAAEHGITDALILYSLKGFSGDANVFFLGA